MNQTSSTCAASRCEANSAKPPLTWDFPLPRTHAGVLLGNGAQGLMVWGDDTLNITIARAGFWDHRGGREFTVKATFAEVRRLVELGDETGVKALFAPPAVNSGGNRPDRPQQYGGGRLVLRFPDGLVPKFARLNIGRGILEITLRNKAGDSASVRLNQAMQTEAAGELAWIESDAEGLLRRTEVILLPFWDTCRSSLADLGVSPPERWGDEVGGGFVQRLPEDEPLALAWRRGESGALVVATALGAQPEERVKTAVSQATRSCLDALRRDSDKWWTAYWRDVPSVELPDAELQHAYDYGVYKQAGLSTPGGVAATLQGPWMEEYQIPPWSNDYHFNINVQLVYGPCLPTNRAAHLNPLWDMVRKWLPELQANGERFFGAPGALMLPHAVDDRCRVIGTFWTGTIDHACTAWVALMAWQHYRYTLDTKILEELAWPLLKGAFNGFHAMVERMATPDCKERWSLPVSVSPEYNGAGMDAWGRDASFQLAAFHRVAEALGEAATLLGRPADSRWAEAMVKLPPYTTWIPHDKAGAPQPTQARIALWEGQDLAVSHRHHSHLASIYPFASIDPFAPEHRNVVSASIQHWNATGSGMWTGWCVPWASILCARLGLADAALLWLKFWKQNFTNVGHGTLHNADFSGGTAWADGALSNPDFRRNADFARHEIMQMDAGMGAVMAILELLVQCRRDGIHLLPAIPKRWLSFKFDGVRTEGAFLVGADVCEGRVAEVRIHAEKGGRIRLFHSLGEQWSVDGHSAAGHVYEATLAVGQSVRLHR